MSPARNIYRQDSHCPKRPLQVSVRPLLLTASIISQIIAGTDIFCSCMPSPLLSGPAHLSNNRLPAHQPATSRLAPGSGNFHGKSLLNRSILNDRTFRPERGTRIPAVQFAREFRSPADDESSGKESSTIAGSLPLPKERQAACCTQQGNGFLSRRILSLRSSGRTAQSDRRTPPTPYSSV